GECVFIGCGLPFSFFLRQVSVFGLHIDAALKHPVFQCGREGERCHLPSGGFEEIGVVAGVGGFEEIGSVAGVGGFFIGRVEDIDAVVGIGGFAIGLQD